MIKNIKFILILLAGAAFFGCGNSQHEEPAHNTESPTTGMALTGKQLSMQYCQNCHQYPRPDALDKKTWQEAILPEMGRYMGIYTDSASRADVLQGAINRSLVEEQNIFPEHRLIDEEAWQKIQSYYISNAPEVLPVDQSANPESKPMQDFEVIDSGFGTHISMVKIDSDRSVIYVGEVEDGRGVLTRLNQHFTPTSTLTPPTPPIDITLRPWGFDLTLIGTLSLARSNNPFGALVRLAPGANGQTKITRFPHRLMRPLQTVFEDMNGDGTEEILVAEFGYYTGSLSLYERSSVDGGAVRKRVLKDGTGAIRLAVRDMDEDGDKDIVALLAQGDEGISIFWNDGKGSFEEERVLRFNPTWGSMFFELADFNSDGEPDILYCNGDNGDYDPILKDYHGIRIFENNGDNSFEQTYFYSMFGAARCSAADFDKDGDLDIAAISHFPDPEAEEPRDFVYLKNQGDYRFTAQSLTQKRPVRWTTFDIADLDNNGYQDILLGGFGYYIPFEDSTNQQPPPMDTEGNLLYLRNIGDNQ